MSPMTVEPERPMKQGREVEPNGVYGVSELAAVLRSRGRANSLHDIYRAADTLEALLSRLDRAEKDRDAKAEALKEIVRLDSREEVRRVGDMCEGRTVLGRCAEIAAQALTTPPTEQESA